MKRIFLAIALTTVMMVSMAKKTKTIVVLHTNDTHSCIFPLSKYLADTLVAGRGGFVRRATMIAEERRAHPDLLLLDSGDFSQGSSYYTLFKGDVEVGLMNLMRYDAATIGNHEFDYGVDNMARLFKMADFPIVCANYDFAGTPLEGIVKPYTIIRRNGLKIGIFGVSPQLEGLVAKTTCQGVVYRDPIAAAQQVATELKRVHKCDLVICLSHLGWDIEGIDDVEMMAATKDIDLVLGGHSHTYFQEMPYVNNAEGKAVPNDQNGKSGIFVGKITLRMD